MSEAIEFAYHQGWLIQANFNEQGWSAKAKHPREQHFTTIAIAFPLAVNARSRCCELRYLGDPCTACRTYFKNCGWDTKHLNEHF